MSSFNNENDQCIAAHFLFVHPKNAPAFRLFTPQNKHLYVVIQQRKWSVHRGASFLFLHQKAVPVFRLFTPQNKHLYVVIRQEKWSVRQGASFLVWPPMFINCLAKKAPAAPAGRLQAEIDQFVKPFYEVNQVFEKGFGNLLQIW